MVILNIKKAPNNSGQEIEEAELSYQLFAAGDNTFIIFR
jgi:hypothetical protein